MWTVDKILERCFSTFLKNYLSDRIFLSSINSISKAIQHNFIVSLHFWYPFVLCCFGYCWAISPSSGLWTLLPSDSEVYVATTAGLLCAWHCLTVYMDIQGYFKILPREMWVVLSYLHTATAPKKMCFVNETDKYVDKALIRRDLSLSLSPMVDICNNQRCRILPLVTDPWAEEGVDPLWEQAPSEGVDVTSVLHIKKWHRPLLIICVHSDNLWLLL